ncbi:MAG TPA: hypothetical protein VGF13_09180, partial [Verrucomicrobiae bacterium]
KHIHIVAHSEGTVVTFRGLLEALSAKGDKGYEWIEKVKSLMTIGSPIDKHIVMWPNLWRGFTAAPGDWKMPAPIRWWNYYDYGDPVGFELDTARQWLIHHGWIAAKPNVLKADGSKVPAEIGKQDFFHFPEKQEIGFTRYPLPGKAHNDYWGDNDLFHHFLAHGMELKKGTPLALPSPLPKKPSTLRRWQVVSWVLPYVVALVLLIAGTYLVYKNVGDVLKSPESTKQFTLNVFALAGLLAGVTVVSRVPRLVPIGWWYLLPATVFAAGAALYWNVMEGSAVNNLGAALGAPEGDPSRWRMIIACLAVGIVSALLSKLKPGWGMWPLMLTSGSLTIVVVYRILTGESVGDNPELWPVVLCVLAFLYLWWLAAQLFDLVFIWHRYIRSNLANDMLKKFDPVLAPAKHKAQQSAKSQAKVPVKT